MIQEAVDLIHAFKMYLLSNRMMKITEGESTHPSKGGFWASSGEMGSRRLVRIVGITKDARKKRP